MAVPILEFKGDPVRAFQDAQKRALDIRNARASDRLRAALGQGDMTTEEAITAAIQAGDTDMARVLVSMAQGNRRLDLSESGQRSLSEDRRAGRDLQRRGLDIREADSASRAEDRKRRTDLAESRASEGQRTRFQVIFDAAKGLGKSDEEALDIARGVKRPTELELREMARKTVETEMGGFGSTASPTERRTRMQEVLRELRKSIATGGSSSGESGTGQGDSATPFPEFPNARRAPDGNWYTPDPDRPGKWLRIDR